MALAPLIQPVPALPSRSPIRNPLGIYGSIEYMQMGKSLIKKRPTEIQACKHIRQPDDPEFIPAPRRAEEAWCAHCRKLLPVASFHGNRSRPNGLQPHCKDCRKVLRKVGKSIHTVTEWRWYRGPHTITITRIDE